MKTSEAESTRGREKVCYGVFEFSELPSCMVLQMGTQKYVLIKLLTDPAQESLFAFTRGCVSAHICVHCVCTRVHASVCA